MKRLLAAICCAAALAAQAADRKIDYVRPLAGTDGFGNVYPGAQVPFGGIQISPDTDDDYYDAAAGYKYARPTIMGFSLNHLSGTGIPDLGDFLFMPGVGEIRLDAGTHDDPDAGYRSRYSHDEEWCSPAYYGVRLADSGVKAEMTAAARSGILRFTYPEADDAFILLDMDHTLWWKCRWSNLRLEDERTISGYKLVQGWGAERHVYFRAEFSVPLADFGIVQNGKRVCYDTSRFRSDREAWGTGLRFWVRFATRADEQVTVRVAISSVDPEGARGNLREIEGLTFDEVRSRGEQAWERELARFEVEGPQRTRETFYTSVYRCFLSPFLFQDADGRFRQHDKSIGRAEGFTNYTTFSLWDTYRAYHPLMNLVRPDLAADWAASMLAHYDRSAERMLPVWSFYGNETWCMIGYHAVSVLADMIVKQIPGIDRERAFEAMKRTATNPRYDCLGDYAELGWVPFDKERESVSKTLEYAYDDFCIAQAARALGRQEDCDYFLRRSLSYRNLIDPETRFMRGRDSRGRWRTPFAPVAYQGPGSVHGWGDITEGFTLQYTWYVPHDVAGARGPRALRAAPRLALRDRTARRHPGRPRHPGAHRRLLARQRALPPHRLPLQLPRPAVEVPAVGAPHLGLLLRQRAGVAERQRRLRTDVGVVSFQHHGILPDGAVEQRLQHRLADGRGGGGAPLGRRDDTRDDRELEPREPLRPPHVCRRARVGQVLHRLRRHPPRRAHPLRDEPASGPPARRVGGGHPALAFGAAAAMIHRFEQRNTDMP